MKPLTVQKACVAVQFLIPSMFNYNTDSMVEI